MKVKLRHDLGDYGNVIGASLACNSIELERLLEIFKQIDLEVANSQQKELILVIGGTGAGKTTLINYLAGVELIGKKLTNSKKLVIDTLENESSASKIGHNFTSTTKIPIMVQDRGSSRLYIDCPGFEDTSGAVADIIHAFSINALHHNADQVKFIVVIDEPSLIGASRGLAFKKLLQNLTELFDNEELVRDNTLFVLTKARDIEDFRQYLHESIISSLVAQDKLTWLLSSQSLKVAVFNMPSNIGLLDDSDRNLILSELERLEYISKPELNIRVSSSAFLLLQQLGLVIDEKILDYSRNITALVEPIFQAVSEEQFQQIYDNLLQFKTTGRCDLHGLSEVVKSIGLMSSAVYYSEEAKQKLLSLCTEVNSLIAYKTEFFAKFLPEINSKISQECTNLIFMMVENITAAKAYNISKVSYEKTKLNFETTKTLLDQELKNQFAKYDAELQLINEQIEQLQKTTQLVQQEKDNLEMQSIALASNSECIIELDGSEAFLNIHNVEKLVLDIWNNNDVLFSIGLGDDQNQVAQIDSVYIIAHNCLKFNFKPIIPNQPIIINKLIIRSPGVKYAGGARINSFTILTEDRIVALANYAADEIIIEQVRNEDDERIKELLRCVNMIPACGEFVLDPEHSAGKKASNCLNELKMALPNIQWVSVVAAWFANSLDIANCYIRPGVDMGNLNQSQPSWSVAGYNCFTAHHITRQYYNQAQDEINYGGSINDASVLQFLDLIRAQNLKSIFYPLIMVDLKAKPWRGKMTGAAKDVDSFFEQEYEPFILHYAMLVKGRVQAFIIGSELVGLTAIHDEEYNFPFVDKLVLLAAKVKNILGQQVQVTYAADWSEYHSVKGYWRPLDKLWACEDIDFVGIDAYFPITNSTSSRITIDQIKAGWRSGEGWDYWVDANKEQQPEKHQWNQWKNIEYWWGSQHWVGNSKTAWVPKQKPIWFTEFGFASIDKSSNTPNVFFDPKSQESALPKYSNGKVDYAIQRKALRATLETWQKSEVVQNIICWCWDARGIGWHGSDYFADHAQWPCGHWIDGKIGANNFLLISGTAQKSLKVIADDTIAIEYYGTQIDQTLSLFSHTGVKILAAPPVKDPKFVVGSFECNIFAEYDIEFRADQDIISQQIWREFWNIAETIS